MVADGRDDAGGSDGGGKMAEADFRFRTRRTALRGRHGRLDTAIVLTHGRVDFRVHDFILLRVLLIQVSCSGQQFVDSNSRNKCTIKSKHICLFSWSLQSSNRSPGAM